MNKYIVPVDFDQTSLILCPPVMWEQIFLVYDDILDEFIDMTLVNDLVMFGRHRQKSRTEADGQVVRIHHILVTEFWQTEKNPSHVIQQTYVNVDQLFQRKSPAIQFLHI